MSFEALLNKTADEIEAPKPMPTGTFTFRIAEYKLDKLGQNQTDALIMTCVAVAYDEDVDIAELPENWNQKKMRLTQFLTEDSVYYFLNNFLGATLGLDIEGKSIRELIPEVAGQMFKGYVKHEISRRDNETIIASIDNNMLTPAE